MELIITYVVLINGQHYYQIQVIRRLEEPETKARNNNTSRRIKNSSARLRSNRSTSAANRARSCTRNGSSRKPRAVLQFALDTRENGAARFPRAVRVCPVYSAVYAQSSRAIAPTFPQ